MRSTWLSVALVLTAVLAVAQFIAIEEFLYWRYTWFDIFMHLLGGAALATFFVALLLTRKVATFSVLLAGSLVAWEVFEYVFGIAREANYAFDTALDILMGTLGGMLVYTIARYTIWR